MPKFMKQPKQFMAETWESAKGYAVEAYDSAKKGAKAVTGAVVAAGSAVATQAHAAIDVTGVNTAITNAETSAHSVGTTIIGVVAGLAVVAIVISLVKKL